MKAKDEFAQLASIRISSNSRITGSAVFTLVFNGSSKPDLVVYRAGAAELRNEEHDLVNAKYPILFPEDSSLKIVTNGQMSCTSSGCLLSFKPVSIRASGVR
jgi:hypothetical protein